MRWLRGKEMKDKKVKRKKSIKAINNNQQQFKKITDNHVINEDKESKDEEIKNIPVNITVCEVEENFSCSEEKESSSSDKESSVTESIIETNSDVQNQNLLKVQSNKANDNRNKPRHENNKPIRKQQLNDRSLMEQRRKAAMLKRNNEKVGRFINPPTKYDKIRRRSECSIEDLSRLGVASLQPSPMSSGRSSIYNSWETISVVSPTTEKSFDLSLVSPLLRQKLQLTRQSSRSSLIWGGETSRHSPSPVEIYPTMPPNRYLSDPLNDIISRDEQDGGNNFDFVVHLNVSQYGPDEILVTLEDGKVVVNGKHFSESDYGFESCQFHRQYPIPEGIKKTDIRSKISEEGILTITAKRTESRTRNAKQARRGSKDLELLLLPARSLSSSNDERPATPVLKSPNSKLPPSPSNIKSDGEFTELNMNTYQLRVQCNGYKPEDLDVRVSGMELLVSGRQKINTGDKQIKHKEFTKAFAIPQNADPNSITSRFLQNTLNIEVSKTIRRTSSGNILNNY